MTGFSRLSKGKKILLTGIALVLVMLIVEVLCTAFMRRGRSRRCRCP